MADTSTNTNGAAGSGGTAPPRNGVLAAMIDAEVNEGGPPSSSPCDTPVAGETCHESHHDMMEGSTMYETCPSPDKVLHLPLGTALRDAKSSTLMKTSGLELIRLVVPAGKEIPPHRAAGEVTIQCVEGLIAFQHDGRAIELHPGEMLHLCPQESHSLKGVEDSSVLVTMLRPHAEPLPETFPAP